MEERINWILDNLDTFKDLLITQKTLRKVNGTIREITDLINNYAFSFLMVIMGEHIPSGLWSMEDYSRLCDFIFEEENELIDDAWKGRNL